MCSGDFARDANKWMRIARGDAAQYALTAAWSAIQRVDRVTPRDRIAAAQRLFAWMPVGF